MYCSKCGEQIPNAAKFCDKCGETVISAYEESIETSVAETDDTMMHQKLVQLVEAVKSENQNATASISPPINSSAVSVYDAASTTPTTVHVASEKNGERSFAAKALKLFLVAGIVCFLIFGFIDTGDYYDSTLKESYSAGSVFSPDKYEVKVNLYGFRRGATQADADRVNRGVASQRQNYQIAVAISGSVAVLSGIGLKVAASRQRKRSK